MSFEDEDFIPESGAIFNFGEIGCEELISKIWIKNDPVKEMCCGDDFIVLITSSGRVFSYGKNDWGQLGLGHCNASMNPISIKSLKSSNEKAVHVACGRCHTIISTESTKLFAFGSNSEGQLGLDESIRSVSEPTEITSWNGGPIKQLSAGGEFSAALTEQGNLYVWGSNSDGQLGMNYINDDSLYEPTQLKFFSSPVTSMDCGAYHMGAIVAKVLYVWGEASDGKLGLGDNVKSNQNFPQKVLLDSSAKQVACGNNHSACLTSSGDVYIWGQGESGQLGLGPSETYVTKPSQLKLPSRTLNSYGHDGTSMEKFVKISVGERHTSVINAFGLVFTFGDGRHGKLGNFGGSNSYSNRMWPTLIEKFNNSLWAEDVCCGGCHTIVLVRQRRIDEQLDDVNLSYTSSTIGRNTESHMSENGKGRARRHRKIDMNKENNDDDSNLPTLKAVTLSNTSEIPKRRKESDIEIEEEISGVKTSLLKSSFSDGNDTNMNSTSTDDLEKIQGEMKKHVINPGQVHDPTRQNESLNEKVDKFAVLMDTVYGDSVAKNEESTEEIVRKRQKKKRKIKAVESKQDQVKEFDQSVWNNDLSSDNEEKNHNNPMSTDGENKRDKPERQDGADNPEVAKIGCQTNCKGNQKSGTCSML